ncbi:MAG: hypothetical protein ABMA64_29670 [Myxococcota bacterium]
MRQWIWAAVATTGCISEITLKNTDTDTPATTLGDTVPSETDVGADTEQVDTEHVDTEQVDTEGVDTGTADTTDTDPLDTGAPVDTAAECGDSWRDLLPPLPAPLALPASLPAGAGLALANCAGDPVTHTDPAVHEFPETAQAHVGGKWYFEVEMIQYDSGWSEVGIGALPSEVGRNSWSSDLWSSAGYTPGGLGMYGVAADLDAGHVGFYVGGALVAEADLSLDPGVGAFRAGGVSMAGCEMTFNYGSQPFAFDPPAGFSAWSSSAAGGGACPSDADVPAPAAPIDMGGAGGVQSTFLSDATAGTELVVLGTYASGGVGGWDWQEIGGVWQPVPNGNGSTGAILVEFDRPGPTELALIAYEPTDWTLVPGPASDITKVVVYAMHPQTVVGAPAGIPVEIHTICADGDGGWCITPTGESFPVGAFWWPFDIGGGSTQAVIDLLEAETCLPLKVFGGTYETQHIVVD